MQGADDRYADVYDQTTRLRETSLIKYVQIEDQKDETLVSNLEVTELNNTNYLSQTQEIDEANAVFSSSEGSFEDDAKSFVTISPRRSAMYLQKGFKSSNQIKKVGVIKFDTMVTAASKLDFDESPFIYLTANPKYLDVLCVSCYECVPLSEVDHHSSYCKGLAD